MRRSRLQNELPARRPNKLERGCRGIWNTLRSVILLHPQARRGRRAPTSWSWRRRLSVAIPPASKRNPASKPASQPASEPASRPAGKPADGPASKPARAPARQPANQPTIDQPEGQLTSQPADQPPRQPTLQLPSQLPCRLTSQSGSHPGISQPATLVVRWELFPILIGIGQRWAASAAPPEPARPLALTWPRAEELEEVERRLLRSRRLAYYLAPRRDQAKGGGDM